MAHVGSKTACGATIVEGSPDTFVDVPTSYIINSNDAVANYDEQFRLINKRTGESVPNYPYYIETSSGEIYFGETDENGLAPRVYTSKEEQLEIWVGCAALQKQEKG